MHKSYTTGCPNEKETTLNAPKTALKIDMSTNVQLNRQNSKKT